MKISPIISIQEFQKVCNDENVVIVEAGSGGKSRENYYAKHLENAFYVDLNKDLAQIPKNAKNGGRHPLPDIEKFAKILQKLGISENSHVIIYDDKKGANSAARFWWMLKALNFKKIQVLNGGLKKAEKSGIKITPVIPKAKSAELLTFQTWNLPLIEIKEIEQFSKDPNSIIIDVRESERYNGESEPIDLVAGHIPNAINLPFKNNLDENGLFKSPEILKKYFKKISDPEKTSVHCGSGVTACHTLLAMDYAGMPLPKLYVGSWSEWSRNEKPIAVSK